MSDERRMTVGASDVPAILGLSPWQTPVEAWARLTGLVGRTPGNNATRRGQIIEPALLWHYAKTRGVEVTPGPGIDESPIVAPDGWRHCRPDGIASDGLLVEAKTTRRWDAWGPDGTDQIPVYYAAQVAWQLSVMDAERAAVIAYCPTDDDVRCYEIVRRRDVEARLVGRVERWMAEHVWPAEPVQPAPLPMPIVQARYASGGEAGRWVEATDEDRVTARELSEVRLQIAQLEARELALRARLCERVGDAYGLKGICTWGRVSPRETVVAADLKAGWPEVYAQVAKRGAAQRQFRFTFKES